MSKTPWVDLEPLRPEHASAMFEGLADPSGYIFLPADRDVAGLGYQEPREQCPGRLCTSNDPRSDCRHRLRRLPNLLGRQAKPGKMAAFPQERLPGHSSSSARIAEPRSPGTRCGTTRCSCVEELAEAWKPSAWRHDDCALSSPDPENGPVTDRRYAFTIPFQAQAAGRVSRGNQAQSARHSSTGQGPRPA